MKPALAGFALMFAQVTPDVPVDMISKYGIGGVAALLLWFFLKNQTETNKRLENQLLKIAAKIGVDLSEDEKKGG
jgi:hypothetical protein